MSVPPVAVALDVPSLDEAEELARALAGEVAYCKVGLELFSAHGAEAVRRVGAHAPVFLDLKLHDIPNTVRSAARVLGGLGVSMLTVHASGGGAMVAAAVEGLAEGHAAAGLEGDPPLVLAVTVLTSMDDEAAASIGWPSATEQVPRLALVAVDAGAGGIVCAPTDVATVRGAVGPGIRLVTPGVRPAGADVGDQARVATPSSAIAAGSDVLVIGRPITRADDPVAAAKAIADEIAGGV